MCTPPKCSELIVTSAEWASSSIASYFPGGCSLGGGYQYESDDSTTSSQGNGPFQGVPSPTNTNTPSDDHLAKLTVKELNYMLKGTDQATAIQLKQRRRTVKNRGYAMNCRVRRLQVQIQLDAENQLLRNENEKLKQQLAQANERLFWHEHKLAKLSLQQTTPTPTPTHSTIAYAKEPCQSATPQPPQGYLDRWERESGFQEVPTEFAYMDNYSQWGDHTQYFQ